MRGDGSSLLRNLEMEPLGQTDGPWDYMEGLKMMAGMFLKFLIRAERVLGCLLR